MYRYRNTESIRFLLVDVPFAIVSLSWADVLIRIAFTAVVIGALTMVIVAALQQLGFAPQTVACFRFATLGVLGLAIMRTLERTARK